jgi:hypothetical protein
VLDIEQLIIAPEAQFCKTVGDRIKADVEGITWISMVDGKRSSLLNFKFAKNGSLLILKWQPDNLGLTIFGERNSVRTTHLC